MSAQNAIFIFPVSAVREGGIPEEAGTDPGEAHPQNVLALQVIELEWWERGLPRNQDDCPATG